LSALFIVLLVGAMTFFASWQLPKFLFQGSDRMQWSRSRFYSWYRCDTCSLRASFLTVRTVRSQWRNWMFRPGGKTKLKKVHCPL